MECVALVTGGGRGLGREISIRLARLMPVFMIGRSEEPLRETASAINAAGDIADYAVIDLAVPDLRSRVNRALELRSWGVDTLVLNAGIGKGGSIEDFPLETFAEIFQVNVTSSFVLAKLVLPGMRVRGQGTVCFVSSIAALTSVPCDAAYAASKAAQVSLAQSIARDYRKHGVTAFSVCPSFFESDMTTRSIHSLAKRKGISVETARQTIANACPQQRIMPAAEVADVVTRLCSGELPCENGAAIPLPLAGELA